MRNLIISLVTAYAALVSMSAMAAGTTGERSLVNVAVTSDEFVRLEADSAWGNPDSCTGTKFIFIDPANAAYKVMTAAALTAFASGSKVKAFVDGCYDRNGTTWPILVTLNMIN